MAVFFSRRQFLAGLAVGTTTALDRLLGARALETSKAQQSLQAFLDHLVESEKFPGLSLAVAMSGRLVHTVCSGWADPVARQPVTPRSLFRIASVSKPLTALVTARLIEQGSLRPETPVHAYLQLPNPSDSRWRQITVEHCLLHTGGWDRDKSYDPMFRSRAIAREAGSTTPATPSQIIRHMVGQPLDSNPGSRYAYSNFGYCLLGRIIEKATGLPYGRAVQESILRPLGISSMRLGKTLRDNRAPAEVIYQDARSRKGRSVFKDGEILEEPYGAWFLEAMDAHGGWLASAPDLLRWSMVMDPKARPALLDTETLAKIQARPAFTPADAKVWYGWGWQVRQVNGNKYNLWHTGSLPGTGALLVRRHDGLSWALLANTNANPEGKTVAAIADPALHKAVDQASPLDSLDQFGSLGYTPAG